MKPRGKIDANQREIVQALRAIGASVVSLAPMGGGVPDLLVGYRGANWLLEIKGDRGKLTSAQMEFHAAWRGFVRVVYCKNCAIDVVAGGSRCFNDKHLSLENSARLTKPRIKK